MLLPISKSKGKAPLRAPYDRSALQTLGMLLKQRLKGEEHDEGGEGAQPDFQKDHGSTPARKATQRNQTHPTLTPHKRDIAHALTMPP